MTNRDVGLDVTKAVAMYMVVFLHVRVYAPVADACYALPCVENLCMVSSLPIFLMISGMFSGRLFVDLAVRKILSRMFVCLWPVVTMIGVGGILLRLVLGMDLLPPGGLVIHLLSGGWFFFCLVLCEGMTFVAHLLSFDKVWLRVILLVLGYIVLWMLPYGMFHAVEMLPFFWFGVYALPRLRGTRYELWVGIGLLAAFLSASVLIGDFQPAGLVFHWTSMNLLSFSWFGCWLMLARIALSIAGALGLMAALRIMGSCVPLLNRLATYGMQTMGIFFLHILFLSVYGYCGGWYGHSIAFRLLLTTVLFLVAHYVAVLTKQNRIVSAVLWNPILLLQMNGRSGKAK